MGVSSNTKLGNSLWAETTHAFMKRSKLGVLNFNFPLTASSQLFFASSQSSSLKLIPSFTLKTEIGKIGVDPSPNPSSIALRVCSIMILPSGESSVP